MRIYDWMLSENDFRSLTPQDREELGKILLSFQNLTEESESECWLWDGPLDSRGYGRIRLDTIASVTSGCNYKWVSVHRIAYMLANSSRGISIPPNTRIVHTCGEPSCFNPNHLIAITKGVKK